MLVLSVHLHKIYSVQEVLGLLAVERVVSGRRHNGEGA